MTVCIKRLQFLYEQKGPFSGLGTDSIKSWKIASTTVQVSWTRGLRQIIYGCQALTTQARAVEIQN